VAAAAAAILLVLLGRAAAIYSAVSCFVALLFAYLGGISTFCSGADCAARWRSPGAWAPAGSARARESIITIAFARGRFLSLYRV